MPAPSELVTLATSLGEMAQKRRPDYERAVRGVRWGELPVYAVGSAATLPAALAFACAFEDFLEWPVVVREASRFLAGAVRTLRTGSVVVMIADESAEVAEAARESNRRGARVLALMSESEVLTVAAQETLVLPPAAGPLALGCVQHAAAGYLALAAMHLLKRPPSWLERAETEWGDLPAHLEGAAARFSDAVNSMAGAMHGRSSLLVVGAGLCHAAALRLAGLARPEWRRVAAGLDPAEMKAGWLAAVAPECAVLFLSDSRKRAGKEMPELARKVNERGGLAVALTDANDHDLVRETQGALLLPGVTELPSSILRLALGGWLIGAAAARPRSASGAKTADAAQA